MAFVAVTDDLLTCSAISVNQRLPSGPRVIP